MRNTTIFLSFLLFLFWGCSKNPSIELHKLNGYWEIKEVELSDGSKKKYTINPIVNHYIVNDSLGEKNILQPQFDNTFIKVSEAEKFYIIKDSVGVYLFYKTPYSEWKDEVLELSDSIFIIENSEKIKYIYKRYVPFNLK